MSLFKLARWRLATLFVDLADRIVPTSTAQDVARAVADDIARDVVTTAQRAETLPAPPLDPPLFFSGEPMFRMAGLGRCNCGTCRRKRGETTTSKPN